MQKPLLYFLFILVLAISQVSCGAPAPKLVSPTSAQPVDTPQPSPTVKAVSPTPTPFPTTAATNTRIPTPALPVEQSYTLAPPQGALARLGKGQINTFTLSSDGTLLAVASTAGVFVYQASSLAKLWEIVTSAPAVDVAFSPDSAVLAAVLDDGPALLWETSSGKQVHILEKPTTQDPLPDLRMSRLAFSPNGGILAIATRSGSILLWDAVRGESLPTLEDPAGGDFASLAFSPDGRILVSAQRTSLKLKVWDPSLAMKVRELDIELEGVLDLSFSPDGSTLAVLAASADQRKVFLWDAAALMETGQASKTGKSILDEWAGSLAFSPDGQFLVTGSRNAFRLWDAASGEPQGDIIISESRYPTFATHLAFSPDGKLLFALRTDGAETGPLVAWDLAQGKTTLTLEGFTHNVTSLAISSGGRFLAAGYGLSKGSIALWELARDAIGTKRLAEFTIPDQDYATNVTSLAFSPDGKILAVGAGESIFLWDLPALPGQEPVRLEGTAAGAVLCLAFSPDAKMLVAAYQTAQDSVIVWDLVQGKERYLLPVSNAYQVGFSPRTSLFAVGSGGGGSVTVWDSASGEPDLALYGAQTGILDIAYSQDGNTLAALYNNGKAFQWEAPGGKLLRESSFVAGGDTTVLYQAVFSPEGSILATGTYAGEVRFLDLKTTSTLRTLQGHTEAITSLAFSPDGLLLASGSADGTVIIWNVVKGP